MSKTKSINKLQESEELNLGWKEGQETQRTKLQLKPKMLLYYSLLANKLLTFNEMVEMTQSNTIYLVSWW